MTCCSVQHWDRKFVKIYVFLSFAENMGKNIGKNISKNLRVVTTAENCLTMLIYLQQMHSKFLQKEQFKKEQKQLVIWLEIKSLVKIMKISRTSQENNLETVTNSMIKKCLKKDVYLQEKERKLLMIWG